jgi:hypothetical protein
MERHSGREFQHIFFKEFFWCIKIKYLKKIDLNRLPHSWYHDVFGISQLESLACGLKYIVGRGGGEGCKRLKKGPSFKKVSCSKNLLGITEQIKKGNLLGKISY